MRTFAHRHPVLWAYLYFCYFSVTIQILVYSAGMSGSNGVRDALLMSTLWLIPVLLWPRYSKLIAAVIGLALWLTSLASIGYWLIYGQEFSQSAIFIIFESNPAEGNEFIQSYLQSWHVIVFAIYSIIPIILWLMMPPLLLSPSERYAYAILFTLVVGWPFLNTFVQQGSVASARYHLMSRLEPTAPWNLIVGYKRYQDQLKNMEELLADNHQLPPLEKFKLEAETLPDTLVLVIGESTNRQRMSLYGYPRATTPRLDAIRDELTVFNDVITPRPYTIEALQQVLSFADEKHPNAFFDQPTLLNMMKQAGYEITWITNQQTQTRRNTMLTTLSQLADHQVYLNNNRQQNARQYDGVVLKPFINALRKSTQKKMIVVHLLGTHRQYSYRYPSKFEQFVNNEGVPQWVSDKNLNEYNSYDNAVLYNDYVITELINHLGENNDKALLVYFSDHGEEVFDYAGKLFCGRNEDAPSPAMYTVPFITWASPKWATQHTEQWKKHTDRPFTSADFIYTLPDMIGINFDGLDPTRSLVSDSFVPHRRWIGNPNKPKKLKDYDHFTSLNIDLFSKNIITTKKGGKTPTLSNIRN
ncbi:MAG: hypothetical protein COA46_01125 [Porticoccaceae bacterium]|nr:MAG: hypothetical protein COA46_01125 [Porticoccaceae bacterium]